MIKRFIPSIIILLYIMMLLGCTPKAHEKIEIVSVFNDKNIDGDYFLGSGSICQKEYYFVFIKERGGLIRKMIPVENTYIYEGYDKPYAEVVWGCYNKHWEHINSCKLFVPKNTVIKNFEIK